MPSAEASAHLSVGDLIRIASTGARHPHLDSCAPCRRRAQGYAWGSEELRELHSAVTANTRRAPVTSKRLPNLAKASELARYILAAATRDAMDADDILLAHRNDPNLVPAIIKACHDAAALVSKSPANAWEFADVLSDWSRGRGRSSSESQIEAIRIEILFLRSQATLMQGRAREAERFAIKGVHAAEASRRAHPTTLARAKYFLASAVAALGRTDEAVAMFREAQASFGEFEMRSWTGRTEAAIGLALFYRSKDPVALTHFASALDLLDPAEDSPSITGVLINRGLLQVMLGRREEGRKSYMAAIDVAMKAGLSARALVARVNLLGLAILDARYEEVIKRAPRIIGLAEDEFQDDVAFWCRLFLAEALFATGNVRDGAPVLEGVIRSVPKSLKDDGELATLLSAMDPSNAAAVESLEGLKRVRSHLEKIEEAQAFGGA